MNVIRVDNFVRPRRERRDERERESFAIPTLPKYRLKPNSRNKRGGKYTSGSSNITTSSSRRGGGRGCTSTSTYPQTSSRKFDAGATTGGSSTFLESASVVLAITIGRGDARTEVGMAALDIRRSYLILCQISDCQTYVNTLTKIYLFDPVEVLMPDTMCARCSGKNVLYQSIREKFPTLEVTPISRIHFNESTGMERVRTLCASEYSSVELFLKDKYYALAAASALLKYVEFIQRCVYGPKSMRIEFQGSPNTTVIDMQSARSLELVLSQSGQRNFSLLGVLDRCVTPMGRKLLRANILQPACDVCVIMERQSSVAELVSNRSLTAVIQPVIRRLYGADRLVALSTTQTVQENTVLCAEQNLNYVLLLKNSLDVVPELREVLLSAESNFFRKVSKNLENSQFRQMRERILEIIHPDAKAVAGYTSTNMQRCFAIKAGINDLLDLARQTYCELIDDMKTMTEELAARYKLALSLGCNASLGYHIQAFLPRDSNVQISDLPIEFIQVRRNKRVFTMTTSALLTLSQQCRIACEELHLMSNVLLCDLLTNIREYIGCLFQLSADVAELDVISALAQVSAIPEYVRPSFGSKLELLDSTHPIMDVFGLDTPISNDVRASVSQNFHMITGPNMSGKSTYLKQIVLLQIMAQIGSYVPAKKAEFRIADRIFCKITFRDDIDCNASTFTLEMKEAQYIIRSVTSKSLIVLDELCKGTTVEEGSSIAWAICEKLLTTMAFTFAATHFSCLTKLADLYSNTTNHHFEAISITGIDTNNDCRLTYTHRLKTGIAPLDNYGIALAELSGLPKDLTEKARKYTSHRSETTVLSNPTVSQCTSSVQIGERTLAWNEICYDFVVRMYQQIEENKFHRDTVQKIVERIGSIRPKKNGKSEENELATDISTDKGATSNFDVIAKVKESDKEKGSMDRVQDAEQCETRLAEELTNVNAETFAAVCDTCVPSQFQTVSTPSIVRSDRLTLEESINHTIRNSLTSYPIISPIQSVSSFTSIESFFLCPIETTDDANNCNVNTNTNNVFSLPFTPAFTLSPVPFPTSVSPPRLSTLSELSGLSGLHEYCMSEGNFSPADIPCMSDLIDEEQDSISTEDKQ